MTRFRRAIHVFLTGRSAERKTPACAGVGVDARVKPAHDGEMKSESSKDAPTEAGRITNPPAARLKTMFMQTLTP